MSTSATPTPVLTIQQVCSAAAKDWKHRGPKKLPPPNISDGVDPLTFLLLERVGKTGSATGAELAAVALASPSFQCTAENAFHTACVLASKLISRYPLLQSDQVELPERAPLMWDAVFALTEAGRLVLDGKFPNCLLNGYAGSDSKMPPIKAALVAEAIRLVSSSHSSESPEKIDSMFCEPDFACPCVVEGGRSTPWTTSGKGNITCLPNFEVSNKEVHVNMIPLQMGQEKTLEILGEVLEGVPGVEECEGRSDSRQVPWYRVVVKCKNEQAAKSCLEALVASSRLKCKIKVNYSALDPDGHRVHCTPQEILRGFVSGVLSREEDPAAIAKTIEAMYDGERSKHQSIKASGELGPFVLWAFDSACKNRVIALPVIKKQGRGGKGVNASETDIKTLLCARTRQRVALINYAGLASTVDVRQPDPSEKYVHPAESLPEGATGVVAGVGGVGKKYIFICTSRGLVKKMASEDVVGGRRGTKVVTKTSGGDSVAGVAAGNEDDDIVLISALGQAIRFEGKQVRSMGGGAKGIAGMALKDGDSVVSVVAIPSSEEATVFVVTSTGTAKSVLLSEIPSQNRGRQGVQIMETGDYAKIVTAVGLETGCHGDIVLGTRAGKLIRFDAGEISLSKRGGGGVSAIEIGEGDSVIASCLLQARTGVDDREGEPLQPSNPEGEHKADTASQPLG